MTHSQRGLSLQPPVVGTRDNLMVALRRTVGRDRQGSQRQASALRTRWLMPVDLALDHIEDVLGDVRRVVRKPLQLSGHAEQEDGGVEMLGVGAYDVLEGLDEIRVERVDLIVGGEDRRALAASWCTSESSARSMIALVRSAITDNPWGTGTGCSQASEIARSAMLTPRSPMRSSSLLILTTATMKRRSLATGW